MIRIGRSKTGTTALLAYPAFGYPTEDGHWRVFLSGIAWQEPVVFSLRQRMMIRMLAGVMKASPEDLESELFQDRITPFMAEADDQQAIIATIGSQPMRLRKKTRKNGHFRDFVLVPDAVVRALAIRDEWGNQTLEYSVQLEDNGGDPATGLIYLLAPSGTSVISDIDDTIKDSEVGDRQQLLTNTFLRDFRSVAGMADVYRQWAERGINFHYVSSSPWQLFVSLQQMHVLQRFPPGTMHLRNFRLRDQLLKKVTLRRHGKTTAIRFLMKHLPDRKFILIGDSVEKDPEIYRKIFRKYPARVKGLLIRDAPHRPLKPDRIRKLEEALPAGLFARFSNADELQTLAQRFM